MLKHGLEAVLIGNAGDSDRHVDLSLPETLQNLRKLKTLVKESGLLLWQPIQPTPYSFRLAPDEVPASRSRSLYASLHHDL